MKKSLWAIAISLVPVVSGWAAASVTVNQSGAGDFTTIQAAINSGASLITITDSSNYVENLEIGSPDGLGGDPLNGGPPVTLTSNQSGTNRPVITPFASKSYVDVRQTGSSRQAGFGLFANNSVVSNLIIEAQPDLGVGMGAMYVMATNVIIENCLFRIAPGTLKRLPAQNPLLFFAEQLGVSGTQGDVLPGGRDCNGCLARNCEFVGVAPDAGSLDMTPDNGGYIGAKTDTPPGFGQGSGYFRMDHYSDGRDVFVTLEGRYFHHDQDYGLFPSNFGTGAGSINVILKKCRLDANGKFLIRGRGANIFVESSVFTRAGQNISSDTQNSAIGINWPDNPGVHAPSGSVSNCVFYNCGSAAYQRAYFGGVNNDSGTTMTVDHCTFVDCLSGVTAGSDANALSQTIVSVLSVSNSIFHQIGDSVVPATDAYRNTLTNGAPELVGGLYPDWAYGLTNFISGTKWAAVFNRYNWNNVSQMIIGNCLVGSIDTEDTRSWDQALTDNTQTGCRLFAGYDTNFVGADTVTRGTPVFVNTDPDAPNAFQLAPGSPGQGLGANLAPVLAPKLGISQIGNQLTISWTQPIWMKGSLKSTPSLSSPVWTTVPGVSNNSVAVTIGAGNQFFAIRNP